MGRTRRKTSRKDRKRSAESACDVRFEVSKEPDAHVKLLIGLTLLVLAIVLAVHWPALSAQALSFDDTQYLVDNPLVRNPSWASARCFFAEILKPSTVEGYYQPLAMVSLMLDVAFGGCPDDLRVFHLTSLTLHVVNSALVIALVYILLGKIGPAVLVGLLFGVHPMTVESVCWICERKTLLASLFGLASLICYVRFARKGGWLMYAVCVAMYLLALLSKPTTVPLPIVMLLLDYWPLRRLGKRAILEKIPLFVLAGVFAGITIISQGRSASVTMPTEYASTRIPLIVCHNIIFYLCKIVWPIHLSSHYPFPDSISVSVPMVGAGLVGTFLLISALIVSLRWTPVLVAGWLIFFVIIFPTIGVVGFTNVIAADKYVYLPAIGLLLILAWGLSRIWNVPKDSSQRAISRQVVAISAVAVLAVLASAATRRYHACWQDTETLHRHMIDLAPRAGEPRVSLAYFLAKQGRQAEAIEEYRETLRVRPNYLKALNNLGHTLADQGLADEAVVHLSKAVDLKPDFAVAHANLGEALNKTGKRKEANDHLSQAVRLMPDNAYVHLTFGEVLVAQGRLKEAISCYRKALAIDPNRFGLHNSLGIALARGGQIEEATQCFRQALRLEPDSGEAHSNLANALISQGQASEAIAHYKEALRIDPNVSETHNNLANALFQQGILAEAMTHYNESIALDPANAEAHYNLGLVLERQGRIEEAVNEYRQVVRLNPSHANARKKLEMNRADKKTTQQK